MYAKCGRIHKDNESFDKIHDVDTISWTTMYEGYEIHGYKKDSLKLFDLMKPLGINPCRITFIHILFAFFHVGLVDEGCKYFNNMSEFCCIILGMSNIHALLTFLAMEDISRKL